MKQAEWNDITWGSSNNQMVNISSFSISQSLNTEEQEAKDGQNKTTIKSLNSEELTVNYKTGFSVGTDPRGELDMLKECIGMQDEFILAGEPLSETQFELDEISLSNVVLSDTGQILAGEISMKFNTEKAPSSKGGKGKSKKSKKGKKGGKKTSSLTLSPADIAKAKGGANK